MSKMVKLLGLVVCLFFMLAPLAIAQVDFCEGNFDYDKDQDGTDAFTFKTDFGRSTLLNPCPADGPAPVPKTGQTLCYEGCIYGEVQKGVPSPNPRFTIFFHYNNGTHTNPPCDPPTVECENPPNPNNDMVLDNLTGLYWTRNANISLLDWVNAVMSLPGTALYIGGYGDWRLPNVKELQSLIDFGQYSPALPSGHPFVNVQSHYYWSSTTYTVSTDRAWYVSVLDGFVDHGTKIHVFYVWPVRGGQ